MTLEQLFFQKVLPTMMQAKHLACPPGIPGQEMATNLPWVVWVWLKSHFNAFIFHKHCIWAKLKWASQKNTYLKIFCALVSVLLYHYHSDLVIQCWRISGFWIIPCFWVNCSDPLAENNKQLASIILQERKHLRNSVGIYKIIWGMGPLCYA